MTPRERVLAAVRHRQPDRIPFSWGFGPTGEMTRCLEAYLAERGLSWPRLRAAVDDVRGVGFPYVGPPLPERADIWGVRRRPMGYGAGTYSEIEHCPLAGMESAAEVNAYPWPDPDAHDYEAMRAQVETAGDGGRYAVKLGGAGNPFEIYCWMTGLEESLINVLANPEVVAAALERITGFFEARLERALEVCGDRIDLVFLADDLGSQQGLLLSREHYRRVLQPFHRRLAGTVHRLAPHATVMFHSDGAVYDILPDLLDAGIDMLEAVQTDAAGMEPERLKAGFGDRLSFHGGISVQSLLPHGTPEHVEAECRRLVRVLGAGGGYIAAPSHAVQVGTPPENVLAMLRAVLGEDDYAAALEQASA